MSSLTLQQAYRAFNRAMAPLHEEHSRALEAGAAIDCGEWSAESIDLEYDRKFKEVEDRVLTQLGYTTRDMYEAEQDAFQICMAVGVAP